MQGDMMKLYRASISLLLVLIVAFQLFFSLHIYGASTQSFMLENAVYIGNTSIDADGARGALVLSKNTSGGYYDVMVSGIDYTPEPNFFDVAVLRVYYNETIGVRKIAEFNEKLDNGFSPSTNLLPGWRVGLSWSAIVAADNRPYGEAPLNIINIYGVLWDGKKINVTKLIESEFSKPVLALRLYPGYKREEVLVFYRQVEEFEAPNEWLASFGIALYNLNTHELIDNIEIPLKLKRSDRTYYITLINGSEFKTTRYNIVFVPYYESNEGLQGLFLVTFLKDEDIFIEVYKINFNNNNIEKAKEIALTDYNLFLSYIGEDEEFNNYQYALAAISTSTWKIHVITYKYSPGKVIEPVFDTTISRSFNRAYLVLHNGIPLMVFQDDSTLFINDLKNHEVKAASLSGSFYTRLISYKGEYIAVIGKPGSETTLHFVLLNPPKGVEKPTQSTTTLPATETASSTTSTTTTTTTTATETTTQTKTQTTTQTTSTTAMSEPLILGEGDWLKYELKMHGKGPLGEMNIEAEVKVYVEEVDENHIKIRIKPLTELSQEEKSLVMLASITGNNVFLAIAGGEPTSIVYSLPLGEPEASCPIIVKPTEERVVKTEDEMLGHKYSVECRYTSKGVLQEMKFKDTYSAGGQTLETEATLKLVEASKDVGLSQEESTGTPGISLSNPIIIGGVVAAVVVVAIIAIVLAKKK